MNTSVQEYNAQRYFDKDTSLVEQAVIPSQFLTDRKVEHTRKFVDMSILEHQNGEKLRS